MTRDAAVEASSSERITNQALQAENRPRTASEKYIASLWAEIIGLDEMQLTLSKKFVEVGGNSLTLNVMLNRIEAETGVSLKVELFFDDDKSSLFELAKELDVLLEDKPVRC